VRVIVIDAVGSAGRAILETLAADKRIDHVVSLIRPGGAFPLADHTEVEWREVNLSGDLSMYFRFADAVVYAGWPVRCFGDFTPNDSLQMLENVCRAVVAAGVHTFVYGSSVGVYSPAPRTDPVGEDWPTSGLPSSCLSQQIAQNEQFVMQFAASHEVIRAVCLRFATIISATTSEPPSPFERWGMVALGRKLVSTVTTGARAAMVPSLGSHLLQVVHVGDVASAFSSALTGSVVGPFNIASEPFTTKLVAQSFNARGVPMSPSLCSQIFSLFRRLRLHTMDPAWVDIALESPVLDQTRAVEELGWTSRHSAASALEELARTLAADSFKSTPGKERELVLRRS
jgi:UDP-glucose 4-epimerase